MTLAMMGGQTIEYWMQKMDDDERLVWTAYEVCRMLNGGKPRDADEVKTMGGDGGRIVASG